jgi:hypothetical protein
MKDGEPVVDERNLCLVLRKRLSLAKEEFVNETCAYKDDSSKK